MTIIAILQIRGTEC